MRYLILFAVCVAMGLDAFAAIDRHAHEYGTVKEDGGPVSATFTISNPSDRPLNVIRASVNCPCITVDIPRRPIAPGGAATLTVKYDPQLQRGHFTKTVIVRYDSAKPDTVKLTGTIKATRPRIDTSGYPHDFGYGVRTARASADFGALYPGQTAEVTIPMINGFEMPMMLDLRVDDPDSGVLVPYGMKLPMGGKGVITIRITMPMGVDSLTTTVTPVVNGIEATPIPVRARVRR